MVREFIEFGRMLYVDDARWIPPFRRTLARQLSPDYPFYNRPGNDHCHFLAYEGTQVLGRVSAMVNAAIRDEDGTATGLIGFFECVEDPVVATVLLDAARDWLRDQHGLRRIWGPMNFDIWHSYRFMTQGFDQAPFYGEPDNKTYYPAYFEHYGFARRRTWHSFEVVGRDALEAMIAASKPQHDDLVSRGYRFVSADNWDPNDETRLLHDLISRSFAGFLGFTPIALEEFAMLFRRSKAAVALPMSFVLHDPSDRPVGFAITYYELSAAVRAMHGREGPLSKAKFLVRRRQTHRLNFFAAGMVRDEQDRGMGFGKAGLFHVVDQALQHGYADIIFALMASENRVQGLFRRAGLEPQRDYVLYELDS
jgi:GNAT superfamily N-acetyltransferase